MGMERGLVLTVDDDANLQTVIEHYLEAENYGVVKAGSVKDAIEAVGKETFHVILLDLGLPDGEGLSLISRFKHETDAAIIVVSGKDDTTEKIICLEMGADDYLTKPFEMRELSARIKAVMRRMESAEASAPEANEEENAASGRVELEHWVLDRGQYQLFDKNGKSLELTTGEFQLLEALVLSAKRALSREQLFEKTRDGEYDVYDRAIDIQIARIRKKIGDDDNSVIKTIRGVGYMYDGKADAV